MPRSKSILASKGRACAAAGALRYTVAACGGRASFENEVRDHANLQWTADCKQADVFIAPAHVTCDRADDGTVIAKISRLGVLIGVVKDRGALARQLAIKKKAPARGAGGRWIRTREGMFACIPDRNGR